MALFGQRRGDVAHVDRTIKLAGVRRGTDQDDFFALDLLAGLFGFAATFRVFLFQAVAVRFEDLLVGFVGAQCLLLREQEVAGIAVLYGDDVTDRAELFDPLKENDIHDYSPYFTMYGSRPM